MDRSEKESPAAEEKHKAPFEKDEPGGPAADSPAKNRKLRRKILAGLGLAIILVGVPYGVYLWKYYSTHESTDDAFVEGRVSIVSPRVDGAVEDVMVEDNQHVKKGDLLVQIDPRDFEVKVALAQAAVTKAREQEKGAATAVPMITVTSLSEVDKARAELAAAETKVGNAEEELREARAKLAAKQAAVEAAKADLDAALADLGRAKLDYKRAKKLLEEGVIAQGQFDREEAVFKMADAVVRAKERRLEEAKKQAEEASVVVSIKQGEVEYARHYASQAKARLTQSGAEQGEVEIKQAEHRTASAGLQEAQANLEYAKLQLEYTRIRAPFDGNVTKKTVEVGQRVEAGQPLLALVDLDDVWIVANFKETQLTQMKQGQPVEVTVDAYPDIAFKGRVDSIQAGTGARFSLLPPENATGNFVKVVQRVPVKIVLDEKPNNPHHLRPGMSAIATVTTR